MHLGFPEFPRTNFGNLRCNLQRCFDRGQTREVCEKQEKCLKGEVVTFTVQSLILCQYPVDLLTFLELY